MKLDQIEGARTLAATWIVVHHMLGVDSSNDEFRGGPAPESPFNPALGRAGVGVSFFIVLSGFITHWVYGRPQRWDGDLMKFYINRLDRVLLTATLTMLVGAALGKITGAVTATNGDPADLTAPLLLSCLTYIHWRAWSYNFPPAQLGDFMLGVATASLALRTVADAPAPGEVAPLHGAAKGGAASESSRAGARVARWWRDSWVGLLADAAVLTVVCLVALLPFVGGTHNSGWDPLLDHALAPLIALWLLTTTIGSPAAPGGVARVLRHPALASMGKYAFHVYLLHALVLLVASAWGVDVEAAPSVVTLLLISWLLGGLYCEYVEGPSVKMCRTGFKACRRS